jgi:Ca2+-binding RTX toxin-like protein
MIRATTLTAAALLGLTLLAPATSSAAAAATCQGVPATIVGSATQPELRGTDGPDVIVTNGSALVLALGGDDLICVTGANWAARIDAGDGDDTVDATGAGSRSATVLGAGADLYTGSAFDDSVVAGTGTTPSVDTHADVIDTAAGYDDVITSGEPGTANPDRLRMNRGTLDWRGIPTAGGLLDGGSFSRLILALDAPGRAVLDNRAGTLTREGAPTLAFTGFTQFTIGTADGSGPFQFVGSDLSEGLYLTAWRFLDHRADMFGGSDRVFVTSDSVLPDETSYDGGAGARDVLGLTLRQEDVDLDLRRGTLTTGWGDERRTTPAHGFESASVAAQRVDLVGTARPNSLQVDACRARVEGLAGSDRIATFRQPAGTALSCPSRRVTFIGGAGHDAMRGTTGPDRLLGGAGRDTAQGRQGRDVCEAEKRQGCEVRR